jgi:hypothetical protein
MSVRDRVLGVTTLLVVLAGASCSSGSGSSDAGTGGPPITTDGGDGGGNRDASADFSTDARDGGDAVVAPVCGPFANGGGPTDAGGPSPSSMMSFFVTSQKSMTANLGGLAGADATCQTLAAAVGFGSKTWHAYLSVEHDATNGNAARDARDRIGAGPWFNAKGVMVAATVAALHARTGDPAVFLDEHGNMIPGQWTGAPAPLEHDILTGSNADGTLAVGKTCSDWTSEQGPPDGGAPDGGSLFVARVGHTDGFGPMCATTPANLTSWNSAHDNRGCNNTAPGGGAGRVYCFATN